MTKYSAKDLFADWYREGLKTTEIPDEQINKRRLGVESLLKINEKSFWLDVVSLALGLPLGQDDNRARIQTTFKACDDNFPLKENTNLIRVLSICALLQKIESGQKESTNILILAVLNAKFGDRISDLPIKGIFEQINSIWNKRCNDSRVTISRNTKPKTLKLQSNQTLDVPTGGTVTPQFVDEINTGFANVTSDIKGLHSNLSYYQQLGQTVQVLSEECNVLWWVFSEFSRSLDAPFSEIGKTESLAVVAKELSDLTSFHPGIANYKSILFRAIRNFVEDPSEKLSLKALCLGTHSSVFELAKELNLSTISEFTVCLNIVQSLADSSGHKNGEKLNSVLERFNIPNNIKLSLWDFACQIYLEIMFVRCNVA